MELHVKVTRIQGSCVRKLVLRLRMKGARVLIFSSHDFSNFENAGKAQFCGGQGASKFDWTLVDTYLKRLSLSTLTLLEIPFFFFFVKLSSRKMCII